MKNESHYNMFFFSFTDSITKTLVYENLFILKKKMKKYILSINNRRPNDFICIVPQNLKKILLMQCVYLFGK